MYGNSSPQPILLLTNVQKPMTLSGPLSALLDNEIQVSRLHTCIDFAVSFLSYISLNSFTSYTNSNKLSRPQTVKRIWAYVRAHDLQDPTDRRMIRCDDAMRAVFKQEKVHMCTMNKLLGQNLYSQDE